MTRGRRSDIARAADKIHGLRGYVWPVDGEDSTKSPVPYSPFPRPSSPVTGYRRTSRSPVVIGGNAEINVGNKEHLDDEFHVFDVCRQDGIRKAL